MKKCVCEGLMDAIRAESPATASADMPRHAHTRVEGTVVSLGRNDVCLALNLAHLRRTEPGRRRSVTRASAERLSSQFRGAAGEVALLRWLEALGHDVRVGFIDDTLGEPDLTVGGRPLEIMTAAIAHQNVTGFCVPPTKLRAAQARTSHPDAHYVFMGVPRHAAWTDHKYHVRAACSFAALARTPVVVTEIACHKHPNHVAPPDALLRPEELTLWLECG